MTTLSVTIDDRQAEALREKAARYGVKPEDLLTASIRNLLTQPENDFDKSMKHVLGKNRELYRRLS